MPLSQSKIDREYEKFEETASGKTAVRVKTSEIDGMASHLGSSVTLILANTAYNLPSSELAKRKNIIVMNNSAYTIYLGGSGVLTTTGLPLAASEKMTVDSESGLYAICGSAGAEVRILESA